MLLKILTLSAISVLFLGCSGDLEKLVRVDRGVPVQLPFSQGADGREGVKFSGGAGVATSADGLVMQVTVGPTRHRLQGGDLVMDVGIAKSSTTR